MRRARPTLVLLLAALALSACGSTEPETAGGGSGRAAVATGGDGGGGGPLPAVDVLDLHDGETIGLAEVPKAGSPLLVWFWAPH